jgi:hypothetical protein
MGSQRGTAACAARPCTSIQDPSTSPGSALHRTEGRLPNSNPPRSQLTQQCTALSCRLRELLLVLRGCQRPLLLLQGVGPDMRVWCAHFE